MQGFATRDPLAPPAPPEGIIAERRDGNNELPQRFP